MSDDVPTRGEKRKGKAPTSEKIDLKRLEIARRQNEALALLTAGNSYADIAEHFGYADPKSVRTLINRALADIPVENTRRLRKIALEKLRRIERRTMNRLIASEAVGGTKMNETDFYRLNRLLIHVEDSRRKLEGTEAPLRAELTGKDGAPLVAMTFSQIKESTDADLRSILNGANGRSPESGGRAGATRTERTKASGAH